MLESNAEAIMNGKGDQSAFQTEEILRKVEISVVSRNIVPFFNMIISSNIFFPTKLTHCARGCCIRCRHRSGKNEANEIFVRNDALKQIELIRVVRRQKGFIFSCITISIGSMSSNE